MTTTQQRVLTAIETAVEAEGYDLIRNGQWANTGTLQAVAPGALGSDRTAAYDFQGSYVTFMAKDGGSHRRISTATGMVAFDNDSLTACVDDVVAYLTGQ